MSYEQDGHLVFEEHDLAYMQWIKEHSSELFRREKALLLLLKHNREFTWQERERVIKEALAPLQTVSPETLNANDPIYFPANQIMPAD